MTRILPLYTFPYIPPARSILYRLWGSFCPDESATRKACSWRSLVYISESGHSFYLPWLLYLLHQINKITFSSFHKILNTNPGNETPSLNKSSFLYLLYVFIFSTASINSNTSKLLHHSKKSLNVFMVLSFLALIQTL
jgi:hypothetical protein